MKLYGYAFLAFAMIVSVGCSPVICGELGTTVTLRLRDAVTGEPPAGIPMFKANGTAEDARCADGVRDGGPPCSAWEFALLGRHTLTVTVPGYQPATITVDPGHTGGPCPGAERMVDETVQLTRE